MTRGNLHLKLKNLTGKTPVELIKTMRMKRACELMKETDLSIADIAEQTGFQTPGYFITVFKNHFGETPGTLRLTCKTTMTLTLKYVGKRKKTMYF